MNEKNFLINREINNKKVLKKIKRNFNKLVYP